MFEVLDRQTRLTGNQKKILSAAIIGDALEFFDFFLIAFVLPFLIGPWKLTFGQFAIVFMSSGVGAILGAFAWGWLADRIGRRKVFIGTVLNFSLATGLLYFTPDNGWVYLTILRFFVGFGVGGLYCVDLPLVQEFMPTSKRGFIGGLVTCVIPLGTGLGAAMILEGVLAPMELAHLPYRKGRTFEDYVGQRGLDRLGKTKWRRHVETVIGQLRTALEAEYVVLGGGNTRYLDLKALNSPEPESQEETGFPQGVKLGSNANAFRGGFRLWDDEVWKETPEAPAPAKAKPASRKAR